MQVTINRQLLGLEDLTFGEGTEEQVRGGETVTVTKINLGNLPFSETLTAAEALTPIYEEVIPHMDEILLANDNAIIASTKASKAAVSANNAAASANNADASELLASKWASEEVDVEVVPGKFSSYHWSIKASENVAPALAHAARTDNPHTVTKSQVGLGNVSNIAQVTAVTGTAPIVSSGGTTPAISISAATTSAPGSMSAADKTKLNGIANGAQVNVATDLTVTAGTTAGPTINSSTGADVVIPSASDTNSGVVTTGAQTFAGVKTMTSPVLVTPSIGVATGTSFNSITGLASVAPVAPAVTAAVGTSTLAARQDHVHPTNFTATATDIKMNGTQAVGTLTKFSRADHIHPTDTSRAAAATSVQKDSNTGVVYLTSGTTAQRPVLANNTVGIRYNTETSSSEVGVGTAGATTWSPVGGGGGATGGGTDNVFNENEYIVTTNYTIPTGKSAVTVGDASGNVTINSGVTVTLDTNSRWVVL